MKRYFLILLLVFSACNGFAQSFIHPGGLHKKSDLERIKYMVLVGAEPWLTSYNTLKSNSRASYNYTVQGNTSLTVITRDAPYTNLNKWYSDANAAYYNALMWSITGDTRHADKCVQIFNAWSNLTEVTGGGTESLNGGLLGYLMIEAAEIIKSTYTGWAATDLLKFKNMLVYPGYSNTTVPASLSTTNGTFYWRIYMGDPGRHGNQDLAGIRTMLTMGVFLDNRIMYDRALRMYQGLTHRADDLPYATGPCTSTSLVFSNSYSDSYNYTRGTAIADYGYNGVLTNYFWENGQCQESSRDQGHSTLGGALCQTISEIAWNQGDDVYSLSGNRLLLGLNYMTRYNVSAIASYPDQLTPWEPTAASGEYIQRWDRTHRWFSKKINPWTDNDTASLTRGYNSIIPPVWEMAIAHYGTRQGVTTDSLKWITRARDNAMDSIGYESHAPGTNDADHPGYGALTCRRPVGCAGDPVNSFSSGKPMFAMNVLPTTIEAENFDYYTGNGEGHSYHDVTVANTGAQYRTDAGVDIKTCSEGGYNLTGLESGEWLTYTVFVPSTGNYGIRIRYAAANGNGKIKFAFGGTDKTTEVTVPYGGINSTSLTDWKDLTVANNIILYAGVQSMKVFVSGTSNAFEINSISVLSASVLPVMLTSFEAMQRGSAGLISWSTVNEANNQYFTVEKSRDGISFSQIAKITALKDTQKATYHYTDSGLVNGSNYYRLLQTDKDGRSTVLGVRVINATSTGKSTIYPNPFNGRSFVLANDNASIKKIQLVVCDAAGKTVYNQTLNRNINGVFEVHFPSVLSNGLYWVKPAGSNAVNVVVE